MSRLRTIATRGDTPVLALSIATGALVALLIAGFEHLAQSVFLERITHRPLYQIAAAPAIGLVLTALLLHWIGRPTSPATSDEFIRVYHERSPRLPLRDLPAKLLAGVATIGFGGALGLEGPSIYAGS
ncbi:MAG: chloride channel protein, partial [Acidimicrobiales bacterium]|nr:chloride channel protein [Acidimicrobiales bacterium]